MRLSIALVIATVGIAHASSSINCRRVSSTTCPDSCSLLGECMECGSNAQCYCDQGFSGANCGILDLMPASSDSGYRNATLSSWGGQVIKAGSGYHMFASAMAENCSLTNFATNSMSIRATAAAPEGPFAFQEVVLPPFHHSTTVVPAGGAMTGNSSDALMMFTIGKGTDGRNLHHCNGTEPQSLPANCTASVEALGCFQGGGTACIKCNEATRHRIAPDACWPSNCPSHKCFSQFRTKWCEAKQVSQLEDNAAQGEIGPHDYMSISTAASVKGPWKERVIFTTDPTQPDAWNCNKSNPSPLVLPNGTILLMYRGVQCSKDKTCRTATYNSCERTGIAVAKDAFSPFIDRQGDISSLAGNEDAFFWKSKRGYHAVFHSKNACGQEDVNASSCGSLAWSPDSYEWHLNKAATYTKTIQWQGGDGVSTSTLMSRQRPKILFDEDGITPLFLYNGVQTEGGRQWTIAVPFRKTKHPTHLNSKFNMNRH